MGFHATDRDRAPAGQRNLVDVVEVQIKPPHERQVMERGMTKENADAYIKIAIMRRGVEHSFYTTQPST